MSFTRTEASPRVTLKNESMSVEPDRVILGKSRMSQIGNGIICLDRVLWLGRKNAHIVWSQI